MSSNFNPLPIGGASYQHQYGDGGEGGHGDDRLMEAAGTVTEGAESHEKPLPTDIEALEKMLESATLDLSKIRKERDKQRQQIEQLNQEQEFLNDQKELRQRRTALQQQWKDQSESLESRHHQYAKAVEDLSKTKTHHRQLKRTFQLLQNAIEEILEQSSSGSQAYKSFPEQQRSMQGQALAISILEKHNLPLFDASRSNHLAGGVGDIKGHNNQDGDNDTKISASDYVMNGGNGEYTMVDPRQPRRYESIESMVSEVESVTGESLYDYDPNNPDASSRSFSYTHRSYTNRSYKSASSSATNTAIRQLSKAATEDINLFATSAPDTILNDVNEDGVNDQQEYHHRKLHQHHHPLHSSSPSLSYHHQQPKQQASKDDSYMPVSPNPKIRSTRKSKAFQEQEHEEAAAVAAASSSGRVTTASAHENQHQNPRHHSMSSSTSSFIFQPGIPNHDSPHSRSRKGGGDDFGVDFGDDGGKGEENDDNDLKATKNGATTTSLEEELLQTLKEESTVVPSPKPKRRSRSRSRSKHGKGDRSTSRSRKDKSKERKHRSRSRSKDKSSANIGRSKSKDRSHPHPQQQRVHQNDQYSPFNQSSTSLGSRGSRSRSRSKSKSRELDDSTGSGGISSSASGSSPRIQQRKKKELRRRLKKQPAGAARSDSNIAFSSGGGGVGPSGNDAESHASESVHSSMPLAPIKKNSSLLSTMLEGGRQQQAIEEASEDTPKTTNTQDNNK